MKLKRFTQFVKGINEELLPEEDNFQGSPAIESENDFDTVDDLKKEVGEDELGEDDFDFEDDEDDFDTVDDDDDLANVDLGGDAPVLSDVNNEAEEEEEEGHEYEGTKLLKELANKLGAEVVNNQIDYNGQKINYYSETEKFHIGKDKFKTIPEVLDFLNVGNQTQNVEELSPEVEVEEPLERTIGESRKYIRRF